MRDDLAGKAREAGEKAKVIGAKARELKDKTSEWVSEQRAKRLTAEVSAEEVGA